MTSPDPGRRPRVAVVSRAVMPLHGMGGLERATRDLVRHLAALECDVTLVTPPATVDAHATGDDPFASRRITIRHVSYITFPFANRRGTTILDRNTAYLVWARRAGRLALALVRSGDVDLVHSQGAAAEGYARARLRGEAPAPLVLNPHGLEEFGATGPPLPPARRLGYAPLRRAVRACARAADAVIATDRSLEAVVRRHLRVTDDRVQVIPNGIDLVEASRYAGPAEGAIARRRHGIGPQEFVFVSVGRLETNKGFHLLPAALAAAAARSPLLAAAGWRWILVGGGPNRAAIEQSIHDHGLQSHTILAGQVSDAELHAWYEAATVFVHPTRYEGSSIVTLEAMSHRKPVIATRVGGLPDKVRPGENGWLVPADDLVALAAALAEASEMRGKLPEMGLASRRVVEQEFAWTAIARRQVALYAGVLGWQ